ncbi:RadC family protein [Solitalea koreensis]|uniref:DNA replication and repair protein RadC n=1 Tax=Solitalea koreensis TaxID=543615 RepID=A0A521DTR6_9SPHI|nr:DNA repair protein RadC [Solitalea koreensis]SMO74972.1 DNA replication and repair protein RadC [Solitalea koreensis]
MKSYEKNLPITAWAEDDRPREKLMLKGRQALSDAELIAILIGSGSRKMSAVELSKYILDLYKNDLNKLALASVKELMKVPGIGEAKAISIVAALELGRRRKEHPRESNPQLTCSADAQLYIYAHFADKQHEEFKIILLNRANRIMGKEDISTGGMAGTVADPKIIFKKAIDNMASGIILCHNHPSGNLRPSQEDIKLTAKLKEAGSYLDIVVLDHLIITDNGFFSFADEGLI